MIVARIELWPHGEAQLARDIGLIIIANDGTGDTVKGNYHCAISHSGRYVQQPGCWRAGRVIGFEREQSPYHLIHQGIASCFWRRPFNEYKELMQAGRALIEQVRSESRQPTAENPPPPKL